MQAHIERGDRVRGRERAFKGFGCVECHCRNAFFSFSSPILSWCPKASKVCLVLSSSFFYQSNTFFSRSIIIIILECSNLFWVTTTLHFWHDRGFTFSEERTVLPLNIVRHHRTTVVSSPSMTWLWWIQSRPVNEEWTGELEANLCTLCFQSFLWLEEDAGKNH